MLRDLMVGFVLSLGLLTAMAFGRDQGAGDAPASRRMEGTWEVNYPDAPTIRHLKVVSKDHFMWTTYEKTTGKPLQVCGGTWTLRGADLTETALFANFPQADLEAALGKGQTMKVEFDGEDRFTLEGLNVPSGKKWRSVMTRVKDPAKTPLK